MVPRYATLDGMRGAAALLVALYHFQQASGVAAIPGYLAVDMFFAISGFIIARTYCPRLADGMAFGSFVAARLARLYPLYLLGLIIGATVAAALATLPPGAILSDAGINALMLPTPFARDLFPLNGPAWSLFFELAVNLLFALALWRMPARAIAAMMAAAALLLAPEAKGPAYFNLGWDWHSFNQGAERTLYSFSAGVLIHRWTDARRTSPAALAPLLLLVALVGARAPEGVRLGWELLCVLALLPGLVALGARIEPPPVLRGMFERLGALSYAVYAIHWPLLPVLAPPLARLGPIAGAALYLAAVIPLAWLAVRCFETPMRAAIRRALQPRPLTTTRPAAP